MRINNLHRMIISTAVIGIAMIVGFKSNHHTDAQVSTTCQTFVLSVPPTVPAGNVAINLNNTSATVGTVQDIIFKIDGNNLGRGVQVGSNLQWQLIWYTQYSLPGSHTISAQVLFTDGSSCAINPVPTTLTGAALSGVTLNASALPPSFQGLTNQVVNFGLKTTIGSTSTSPIDVSQYTYYANKAASLGSITPLDGSAILRFSTGPVAASGSISVIAWYGGLSRPINIPVTIQAQTVTPPASTTTTTTTTVNTDDKTTTSTTTGTTGSSPTVATTTQSDAVVAAASTASIEAEKPLKDCVLTKLGDVRYKAISSGTSRPTAAEFEAMNQCFATRNSVLPSSFVPVAPSEVKNKPFTKDATVEKLENITAGSTVKLQMKGKAKPKSLVLLYVYSEPLVLSTTADSNGDWSYALEDPLQPGKHEAYAVVDKGDGTYQRSSVFDFAIAKASASAANPNGYSLKLSSIQATAKDSNKMNTIYITGIALLTLGMLGVIGFVVLKARRNKKPALDPATNPGVIQPTQPQAETTATPPAPAQPVIAPMPPTPTQLTPEPVAQPVLPPEQLVTEPAPIQPAQTAVPTESPITTTPVASEPSTKVTDHES